MSLCLEDFVSIDLLSKIAPREGAPEPSLVEKAANGVQIGAALGPWTLTHRETG